MRLLFLSHFLVLAADEPARERTRAEKTGRDNMTAVRILERFRSESCHCLWGTRNFILEAGERRDMVLSDWENPLTGQDNVSTLNLTILGISRQALATDHS